jgi:hypothetical protein
MKIKDIITEGASSVLYHYTSIRPALRIMQSGQFELTSSVGNKQEERIAPAGYPYYMSTTRTKVGDYHARNMGSHAVMFVLDGDKISQRYKVKPVDYWERMWISDTSNQRTRESEDRIYSKTPTIPANSITEIHQLVMYKDENRGPIIRNMAILAKKNGIPIYFYDNENSWLLQDKRKSIPVSKLKDELLGQMPKLTHTSSSRRISSLEQWLELIFKKKKSVLSQEANELRYNIVYYGARYPEEDQNLGIDLHNARKPNDTSRPYAEKIIQFMNKNGLKKTSDLKNAMVAKWSDKKVNESTTRNSVTLEKIYNGDFPERDEQFWDHVSMGDMDTPLEIHTLPAYRLKMLLLSQYRVEHLDDIIDMIGDDEDRMELVNNYRNDKNLMNSIIVLSDNRIIDGNHRSLASALNNSPINYVDLGELDGELNEDVGASSSSSGAIATIPSQMGGIMRRNPIIGQSIYPTKKKAKPRQK